MIDPFKVPRAALESAACIAALLITAVFEEIVGNSCAILATGFGYLAEAMIHASNIYQAGHGHRRDTARKAVTGVRPSFDE